ncbi:MAG: DUF1570 domain-containing protein [Phycisphaerae bacterium]|nr:DUF1570 domain-containing protein [Phycisphaerae bacterium]
MRHLIMLYGCVGVLAFGVSSVVDAQARPAQPQAKKADPKANQAQPPVSEDDPYAIKPPTEEEIKAAREWAMEFGDKARRIAPKLRMVETPHFYLFAAYENKAADKLFADTAERMYKELCKQFQVDPNDPVWLDRCPIYAFNRPEQYVAFCGAIGIDEDRAEKTGGMARYGGDGTVCIILKLTKNTTWFCEVMVHEGTHGFMARHLTTRRLPTWVNEGIAEYMAATLIKNSWAKTRWLEATKQALAGKKNPASVFDGVQLDDFDYGIAHSLVWYMIRKDSKAFAQFIRLLKLGESEEDALKKTYKTDRAGLLKAWRAAAAKTVK